MIVRSTPQVSQRPKFGPAHLPRPEVYETECDFIPWGELLSSVVEWVVKNAPAGARVIDFLCGSGTVLAELAVKRPDLSLAGVTLEQEYIQFAQKRCPTARFQACDVFEYQPPDAGDIAICTAGIHHLPFTQQPEFMVLVSRFLAPNGRFIIGEIHLEDDSTSMLRCLSSLDLGSQVLRYAVNRGAPADVIDALVDVLRNDMLVEGEYKLSSQSFRQLIKTQFELTEVRRTWAGGGSCDGDYLYVCSNRPSREVSLSETLHHG